MTRPRAQHLSLLMGAIAVIALGVVGCANTVPNTPKPQQDTGAPTQDALGPQGAARQAIVIGDDFSAGTIYGGMASKNWTTDLQQLVGQAGIDLYVHNFSRSGTGYTPNRATTTTFVDDVRRHVDPGTSLVILAGGANDVESIPALRDAVTRTLEEIRAIAPGAKILVVGPMWLRNEAPPGPLLAASDTIRAAADDFGVLFVDPIAERWFVGRDDVRSPDKIHPNDAGHQVIAQRLADRVVALLRPTSRALPAPTITESATPEATDRPTLEEPTTEDVTPQSSTATPNPAPTPTAPPAPAAPPVAPGPPPGPPDGRPFELITPG